MIRTDNRAHVHDLVDRLPPAQLAAVQGLLEAMLDPAARASAVAPLEDEEIGTEEDRVRFREGQAFFASGKGIPMEDVLAEFGMKPEDFPLKR